MKSFITNIELQFNKNFQPEIILTLPIQPENAQEEVSKLKEILINGKQIQVEIKQYRKKRSLDANAYLWTLCQKIAEVLHSTKEEVYKEFIRKSGQFEIVPIKNEAVERWMEVWKSKGIGWHAEILSDSKIEGYKNIISYYGSSVYNSQEMSVFLEEVVNQCHELGIETRPEEEIQSLLESWGLWE